MNTKNDKIGEVMFELDGVLFSEIDAAIKAAKQSIVSEAKSYCEKRPANRPVILNRIELKQFVPTEPVNSQVIQVWAEVTLPDGKVYDCSPIYSKTIRQVNPRSPLYGKYIAKKWTEDELKYWSFRRGYYNESSEKENYYSTVASLIKSFLERGTAEVGFHDIIKYYWSNAANEMDRNRVAEMFLCAKDVGLMNKIPYHDILTGVPEELAARADELERIRDEANAELKNGR